MKISIFHGGKLAVAEVERTPITSTHKGMWKGRRSDGLSVVADTPYEAADAMGDPQTTIRARRQTADYGVVWLKKGNR